MLIFRFLVVSAALRRCMGPAKRQEPSASPWNHRSPPPASGAVHGSASGCVKYATIRPPPWERALRPSGAGPDSVAGFPVNAIAFCSLCLQRFTPCLRRGGDTGPGPLPPVVAVARGPFYPCPSGFPDSNPFRRPLWGTVCAVIPSDDPGM